MADPTELVSLEQVEAAMENDLYFLHDHVVSLVLAGEFDEARHFAERVRALEGTRFGINQTYKTRMMSLGELLILTKMLIITHTLSPTSTPSPTSWERLLCEENHVPKDSP